MNSYPPLHPACSPLSLLLSPFSLLHFDSDASCFSLLQLRSWWITVIIVLLSLFYLTLRNFFVLAEMYNYVDENRRITEEFFFRNWQLWKTREPVFMLKSVLKILSKIDSNQLVLQWDDINSLSLSLSASLSATQQGVSFPNWCVIRIHTPTTPTTLDSYCMLRVHRIECSLSLPFTVSDRPSVTSHDKWTSLAAAETIGKDPGTLLGNVRVCSHMNQDCTQCVYIYIWVGAVLRNKDCTVFVIAAIYWLHLVTRSLYIFQAVPCAQRGRLFFLPLVEQPIASLISAHQTKQVFNECKVSILSGNKMVYLE